MVREGTVPPTGPAARPYGVHGGSGASHKSFGNSIERYSIYRLMYIGFSWYLFLQSGRERFHLWGLLPARIVISTEDRVLSYPFRKSFRQNSVIRRTRIRYFGESKFGKSIFPNMKSVSTDSRYTYIRKSNWRKVVQYEVYG